MIRIILADDHQILLEGLRAFLDQETDMAVVATGRSTPEVLKLLEKHPIDLLISDIEMPGSSGVELVRHVRKKYPSLPVLALSMHKEAAFIRDILQAGARGYVLKNASKAELIKAIREVASGRNYFSPEVQQIYMQQLVQPSIPRAKLSERELQIVRLIANQMTAAEIAAALHISPLTVKTHRKNILLKLGLRNTAGLIKYAMQQGWIS